MTVLRMFHVNRCCRIPVKSEQNSVWERYWRIDEQTEIEIWLFLDSLVYVNNSIFLSNQRTDKIVIFFNDIICIYVTFHFIFKEYCNLTYCSYEICKCIHKWPCGDKTLESILVKLSTRVNGRKISVSKQLKLITTLLKRLYYS